MVKDVLDEMRADMDRTVSHLRKDYDQIRTGRASLTLLDSIRVDYYGTQTPLNQVATLSIPEARLITIQPWDKGILGEIEKAIQKSELGLTPMNDGKIIRIAIPPLTEERRKELVKLLRRLAEGHKVDLRNHRRGAIETLREMRNEKAITEDDLYRHQEDVQKVIDEFIEKIDTLAKEKEKEVLEI
jgi:ribosome recycling factor